MSYDFSNTFTTQEGAVFDMQYGQCPRCAQPAKLSYRMPRTGYFVCKGPDGCDLMYDEPHFEPAEVAFVTDVSDDQAEHDPELRPYWLAYHDLTETCECDTPYRDDPASGDGHGHAIDCPAARLTN